MFIPYQYFSEGTLRLLAYVVLFSSQDLPEAIVIDDIETALDDSHIEVLMQIVRDAGKRTNIVLTTRSAKVAECAGITLREI
jgi:predicted ATPase